MKFRDRMFPAYRSFMSRWHGTGWIRRRFRRMSSAASRTWIRRRRCGSRFACTRTRDAWSSYAAPNELDRLWDKRVRAAVGRLGAVSGRIPRRVCRPRTCCAVSAHCRRTRSSSRPATSSTAPARCARPAQSVERIAAGVRGPGLRRLRYVAWVPASSAATWRPTRTQAKQAGAIVVRLLNGTAADGDRPVIGRQRARWSTGAQLRRWRIDERPVACRYRS